MAQNSNRKDKINIREAKRRRFGVQPPFNPLKEILKNDSNMDTEQGFRYSVGKDSFNVDGNKATVKNRTLTYNTRQEIENIEISLQFMEGDIIAFLIPLEAAAYRWEQFKKIYFLVPESPEKNGDFFLYKKLLPMEVDRSTKMELLEYMIEKDVVILIVKTANAAKLE